MPIQCDKCGTQSEIEQAFYNQRRSFSTKRRKLCPRCWSQEHQRAYKGTLWKYLFLGVLGAAIADTRPEAPAGWFLLNLFLLEVFLVLVIIPHELGHGLAGRLLGMQVYDLIIGLGRTVFEKELFSFRWCFKALPFGGLAFGAHTTRHRLRLRQFLFILAGPMANLFLAGAIFAVCSPELFFRWGGGLNPASAFFLANAITFVFSLWPYHVDTAIGRLPSDGLALWRVLRMKDAEVDRQLQAFYAMQGNECRRKRDYLRADEWFENGLGEFPESVLLLSFAAVNLIDLKRFGEARARFVQLLSDSSLDSATRYLMLNNTAYVDALLGGEALLAEADDYSKRAFEHLSWMPAVIGTRGTVLVERGDVEEGLSLLHQSMADHDEPHGKALNACYVAIAERKRGNVETSRRYFEMARSLDPDCVLLDRAAGWEDAEFVGRRTDAGAEPSVAGS